jgi:hypothetical protein
MPAVPRRAAGWPTSVQRFQSIASRSRSRRPAGLGAPVLALADRKSPALLRRPRRGSRAPASRSGRRRPGCATAAIGELETVRARERRKTRRCGTQPAARTGMPGTEATAALIDAQQPVAIAHRRHREIRIDHLLTALRPADKRRGQQDALPGIVGPWRGTGLRPRRRYWAAAGADAGGPPETGRRGRRRIPRPFSWTALPATCFHCRGASTTASPGSPAGPSQFHGGRGDPARTAESTWPGAAGTPPAVAPALATRLQPQHRRVRHQRLQRARSSLASTRTRVTTLSAPRGSSRTSACSGCCSAAASTR